MPEFANAEEEQALCGLSLKENTMTQKLLDPIPPGEILLEEFMKPIGVSINALSRDVSVPPNRTPCWRKVILPSRADSSAVNPSFNSLNNLRFI